MTCLSLLFQLGRFGCCSLLLPFDSLQFSLFLSLALDLVGDSEAEIDLGRGFPGIDALCLFELLQLVFERFELLDLSEHLFAVVVVCESLKMLQGYRGVGRTLVRSVQGCECAAEACGKRMSACKDGFGIG